jgi:hypothetical protein
MLDAIKKLAGAPETVLLSEHTALQAEFENFKTNANELQAMVEADLAEATSKLSEALEALAAAQAQIAELQAQLDATTAIAEEAVESAEELRAKARKEKLEALVGTDKAATLMVALADTEDAQFDAVLVALGAKVEEEAASEMFTETGATASVDASNVVEESETMKILKARWGR